MKQKATTKQRTNIFSIMNVKTLNAIVHSACIAQRLYIKTDNVTCLCLFFTFFSVDLIWPKKTYKSSIWSKLFGRKLDFKAMDVEPMHSLTYGIRGAMWTMTPHYQFIVRYSWHLFKTPAIISYHSLLRYQCQIQSFEIINMLLLSLATGHLF